MCPARVILDVTKTADDSGDGSLVGRVLSGRYRLEELIASGGMGAVYRAEHLKLRKRVAVKVLLPHAARRKDLVERFEREAIAGARVHHPHVVAASDFGKEPDGTQFLVLEHVDGTTLAEELAKGPLEPAEARRIARQLAAALGAVHEECVVHRDVKPGNVMLTARGHDVKLVDFGFARVPVEALSPALAEAEAGPAKPLTEVGIVIGTTSYLAPEAINGMSAVDARSDLYALGVMLYEMLAGKHPFDATSPVEMFRAHRETPPPRIRERAPGVEPPPALESIAMRLLAKSPEDRFENAAQVLAALEAATIAPPAPPSSAGKGKGHTVRMMREDRKTSQGTVIMQARAAPRAKGSPLEDLVVRLRRLPPAAWAGAGVLVFAGVLFAILAGRGEGAPAATPSASPAPPPSAPIVTPVPAPSVREVLIEVDGLDAPTWKARLAGAAEEEDWATGAKALLALAQLDEAALSDARTRQAAVSVAAAIAFAGGETAERVFRALKTNFRTDGLEVLFEIVRTRGGTNASKRASELLASPDVVPRVPAGMRLALEFRKASCEAKRGMFSRLAEEGDRRALDELVILRDSKCERDSDPCCFREDKELAAAIKRLRDRLGR